MQKDHTLLEYFASQTAHIPTWPFLIDLVIAGLLAFLLGRLFIKFGTSLSNRESFARNFVLLTMTTMLIISIVKSSLALSLGLVGALSIVRFRAAIKEPEELSYLFLTIAIGLGLGAEQRLTTLAAFGVIAAVLIAKHYLRSTGQLPNLYVTITSQTPQKLGATALLEVLQQNGVAASLRRFDETPQVAEASFHVRFDSVARLEACTNRFRNLSDGVKVSVIEDRGIGL